MTVKPGQSRYSMLAIVIPFIEFDHLDDAVVCIVKTKGSVQIDQQYPVERSCVLPDVQDVSQKHSYLNQAFIDL